MDAQKKIMIIDDESDLTQMIGHLFEAKGFEVQTAADGFEGLAKVPGFAPDLIILDMNMPRMGGIEFYSKICSADGRPLYPVMVLTARSNIKGLFQDLNIDGFMIKPFDIDQLVAEAEAIIKKRSHGSARPRRICIAESDPKIAKDLAGLFLGADYTVVPARNGTAAMEKMVQEVPDVALVHLGLVDIPGDTVIFRLSTMAQTMDVKYVLYTHRNDKHEPAVMERIKAKTGIWTLIEYTEPAELLDKVGQLF